MITLFSFCLFRRVLISILPCSVNFIALLTKLMMICSIFSGSPIKWLGIESSNRKFNDIFFLSISDLQICVIFLRITLKLNEIFSNSSCLDPILEKSNTSLIICSKCSPERCICSSESSFSNKTLVFLPISAKPNTAFIGVLISWLMFDRKIDFALFAAFALSIASFSALF